MPLTAAPGGFFYSKFGLIGARFSYFGFYNYSFRENLHGACFILCNSLLRVYETMKSMRYRRSDICSVLFYSGNLEPSLFYGCGQHKVVGATAIIVAFAGVILGPTRMCC